MTYELESKVGRAAGWSMMWSVLMIVSGLLAIAAPVVAGIAVTAIVGWLLALSGALHLALAWRGAHASAILWEILLGIIYGAIGLYVVVNPIAGLASLTLAISAYLLAEGVVELILFFQLRSEAGAGWLMLDAIITLSLAMLIAATWPSSAAWVVGTVVGISMLLSGTTRFVLSRSVRRLVA